VRIDLAHGTDVESATREQLVRLIDRYDLSPWEFTDRVVIDGTGIPHSHPVLTLHTRHRDDDTLLLSTYLHEQLHWFGSSRPDTTIELAIAELKRRYPNPPVGFPHGADSELSAYIHYLVCRLEYLALRDVVGLEEANRAIEFWHGDHYTSIYRTIIDDGDTIDRILREHDLLPN